MKDYLQERAELIGAIIGAAEALVRFTESNMISEKLIREQGQRVRVAIATLDGFDKGQKAVSA